LEAVKAEILQETQVSEINSSDEQVHGMRLIPVIAEIIKLRITVLVSFTTALGYILAVNNINKAIFLAPLGIFLLACGSAAINHYQERYSDLQMKRTSKRPLPAGSVKPSFVLLVAAIFSLSGGIILYFGTNVTTLFIGLITLIWYNGIYTPLKRKSALAVIPGSLVGALPPLAGWAAGGGDLFDFHIIYVSLYFFLWQIPHFWLLLIVYGDDYKKAGFPVLNDIFGLKVLKILTVFWIVMSMLFAAGTSFTGLVNYPAIRYLIVIASAGVVLITVFSLFREKQYIPKPELGNEEFPLRLQGDYEQASIKNTFRIFIALNTFTLLYILLLYIDKIIFLFR
jgi:protoheme IX farnesyltransferase